MSTTRAAAAIALACVISGGRRADAQRVAGLVRDAGTKQPIAGAVVTTLDAAGKTVARALTNEHGAFSVAASGVASLRVIRIGYTPLTRDVSSQTMSADSGAMVIELARLPAVLGAVQVSADIVCGDKNSRDALALWEQARSGLLATIVARETKPANAVSLTYSRAVDIAGHEVVEQTVRRAAGTTTRPFRARTDPVEFARVGYVQPLAGGMHLFSAPDADVLLDPAFASSHCFTVVRGGTGAHPRLGLAFKPTRQRDDFVDVEGTLWFTAQPLALDELDFDYTGLPATGDSIRAGGKLAFREVPNGVSFVHDWVIRTPVLAVAQGPPRRTSAYDPPIELIGQPRATARVTRVAETGGRVLSASWPDGYQSLDTLGSIYGRVMQLETEAPARHALVVLTAANDTVQTDSTGHFTFGDLLPGQYTLSIQDTALNEFIHAPPQTSSVNVRDDERSTMVALTSTPDSALIGMCAKHQPSAVWSVLIGQVRSAHVDRDWSVRASWQADYVVGKGNIGIKNGEQSVHPDSLGYYVLCGVVRERPVHLSVWRDRTKLLDSAVTVFRDSAIARADLLVPPGGRP